MTLIAPPPAGAPSYDRWRSVLFAVCVGLPIVATVLAHRYDLLLFSTIGAFMALLVDPRRDVRMRVAAIVAAIVIIGFAARAGVALAGHENATIVAALLLAFLAGLPRPTLPYLTLVGKLAVTCVVAGATTLVAAKASVWAFAGGALVSLIGSVVEARFRGVAATASDPLREAANLVGGATNGSFYAATFAATVALAGTLAAVELSESVTAAPPAGAAALNLQSGRCPPGGSRKLWKASTTSPPPAPSVLVPTQWSSSMRTMRC